MFDSFYRFELPNELTDRIGGAANGDHLETGIMVEVHVLRGYDNFIEIVLCRSELG